MRAVRGAKTDSLKVVSDEDSDSMRAVEFTIDEGSRDYFPPNLLISFDDINLDFIHNKDHEQERTSMFKTLKDLFTKVFNENNMYSHHERNSIFICVNDA